MKLELKSCSLHYLDLGKGPAVLLIHAFPLNHAMWEPQLSALSAEFRLLVPDIRGFGGSQPPSAWTMEEMADDLDEFLEKAQAPGCALVGVSMGGYIALSFWAEYPRRVRKLVLANTRARADSEIEKAARNEMIAALEQSGAGILPDRMLPRLLKPNSPPGVVRKVRGMIEETSAPAAIYTVMALRDRPDSSTSLHRVSCPTLVLCGEDDLIVRDEESRAMADAIRGSQFARVPGSGHLSNLENPDEFNRVVLDFLR